MRARPTALADRQTPLMCAAQDNDISRILTLIQSGTADIQAVDDNGQTALHHALAAGHEEACLMLLFHGADKNAARHVDLKTPLMIACTAQMTQVTERLVTLGAQADMQDKNGMTALMYALKNGDGWAACRLAGIGADTDRLKNNDGMNAVMIAQQHLDAGDLSLFNNLVLRQRAAAQEKAATELAENIRDATVLKRNITPLKTITLRPRPPQ